MIRIGIIGVGEWGSKLLAHFSRVTTVSCVTLHPTLDAGKAETLKASYPGLSFFTDFEQMLKQDIDAVVIATPIATHAAYARKAIEGGKHVFVEKPLAMDPLEAEGLVAEAERHGKSLFVGYTFVYDDGIRRLREMIEKERPRRILFTWRKWGSFREGIVHNLLTHDIAIIEHLVGLDGLQVIRKNVQKDYLELTLHQEDLEIDILIDRLHEGEKSKEIVLEYSDRKVVWDDGELDPPFQRQRSTPLENECLAFLGTIAGKKAPTDGEFGRRIVTFINETEAPNV